MELCLRDAAVDFIGGSSIVPKATVVLKCLLQIHTWHVCIYFNRNILAYVYRFKYKNWNIWNKFECGARDIFELLNRQCFVPKRTCIKESWIFFIIFIQARQHARFALYEKYTSGSLCPQFKLSFSLSTGITASILSSGLNVSLWSSVCIVNTVHWTTNEGMLSPPSFFCPGVSSPPASEPQSSAPRWGPHILARFLMKGVSVSCVYRKHVVCVYFVTGFYLLVERCCCVLSEWSLALWFCRF